LAFAEALVRTTTIAARIIEALSEANVVVLEQDNYCKRLSGHAV